MILQFIFQSYSFFKLKKAQGALTLLQTILIGLIVLGIIAGLIIYWTNKQNETISDIPDILEGLS